MSSKYPMISGLICCLLAMVLSGCAIMPNSGASRILIHGVITEEIKVG